MSVDPLTKSYPWYTPYQFAGNTPIEALDLDGAEEFHTQPGNLTPYTEMSRDGNFVNKVNAYIYTSTFASLYNTSSFAINTVYKGIVDGIEDVLDEHSQAVQATTENILHQPITLSDIKSSFLNSKNYEGAPLLFLGALSYKPKVITSNKITTDYLIAESGVWVSTDLKKVEEGFKKAGFKKVGENVEAKNVTYEVPKKNGKGTFYARLQEGKNPRKSDVDGDRIINTVNDGNIKNKDYVDPNGAYIKSINQDYKKGIGHIHLNKK